MLIYLLVILLIWLLQNNVLSIPAGPVRDRTEEKYLRIVCWILVLLAALRGSSVGTDTIGYIYDYYNMPNVTFAEVLERASDYPIYFLLAKTCSFLHFPIQILFGIVAGIYLFAIYQFINRFSEGKLYSILCFMTIGLYTFSLAGLKQTLSMSFVLLYYIAITDRKYIRAALLAVIAYYCHKSSLIFLFGIMLYFMRNMKTYYLYLAIIVLMSLFGTRFLWRSMILFLENDHYTTHYLEGKAYSSTTMFFYGVLVLILFLFSRNYGKNNTIESHIMLGMSALAFSFQAFSFVASAAFRLSYYFIPFMIVGFPNCFNCVGNADTKRWIKFTLAFIILFFFFYVNRNSRGYVFFWQE